MDYITAIGAAEYRGEKIDSGKGLKGIKKKAFMLLFVLLGGLIDLFLEYSISSIGIEVVLNNPIAIGIALWLVINEIISVLENMGDILGDRVPKWLKPFLSKLKSKIEDKTTPDFCKENPESEECRLEDESE